MTEAQKARQLLIDIANLDERRKGIYRRRRKEAAFAQIMALRNAKMDEYNAIPQKFKPSIFSPQPR